MKALDISFYLNKSVTEIASSLLGKILHTEIDGRITRARIVETEAYNGIFDKACHAYNGRRTNRNEHMYHKGGIAYIYVCYGIHHLFNVVTNEENIPDAVLIRAGEPLEGIPIMLERTNKVKLDYTLTRGPGNLSKALGITKNLTGNSLLNGNIQILDDDYRVSTDDIIITKRIGVDYAEEAIHFPYRFFIKNNPYVSGRKR